MVICQPICQPYLFRSLLTLFPDAIAQPDIYMPLGLYCIHPTHTHMCLAYAGIYLLQYTYFN